MKIENGVTHYTKATLIYEFGFPNDMTTCQWCKFCYAETALDRWRCRITGEYMPYPRLERGQKCPVVITEDHNGEGNI